MSVRIEELVVVVVAGFLVRVRRQDALMARAQIFLAPVRLVVAVEELEGCRPAMSYWVGKFRPRANLLMEAALLMGLCFQRKTWAIQVPRSRR